MQLQITGQLTGLEARNGGWFAAAIMEQGAQYPKKLSTKKPELVAQVQQMMGQMVTCLYNEQESTNINPNNGLPYMNRYLEALSMAGQMPMQQPQVPVQQQPYPYTPPPSPPVQQQPQYQPQPVPYAQPPIPQQVPVMQQVPQAVPNGRVSDDVRESRIMRQAAGKVAAGLLPMLGQEDQNLASLIRISEQLVQYFRDGVQWTTPPVQQPVQQQPQQQFQGEAHDAQAQQAYQQHAQAQQRQGGYEQPQGQALPDDDIPFGPSIH